MNILQKPAQQHLDNSSNSFEINTLDTTPTPSAIEHPITITMPLNITCGKEITKKQNKTNCSQEHLLHLASTITLLLSSTFDN